MKTTDEARAFLKKVQKEKPELLLAASNSLVIEAFDEITRLRMELAEMKKGVIRTFKIAKGTETYLKGLMSGDAAPAPAAEGTQQETAAPAPSGKARTRANGEPMTPEECAIEDMMDAATAGMPVNSGGPSSDPAPEAAAPEAQPAPPSPPMAKPKKPQAAAPSNGAK